MHKFLTSVISEEKKINTQQQKHEKKLHEKPISKILIAGTSLNRNLHKEVLKYLQIFKDHPYVFNLGHGILPETKIEMVEELVKIVREFK